MFGGVYDYPVLVECDEVIHVELQIILELGGCWLSRSRGHPAQDEIFSPVSEITFSYTEPASNVDHTGAVYPNSANRMTKLQMSDWAHSCLFYVQT